MRWLWINEDGSPSNSLNNNPDAPVGPNSHNDRMCTVLKAFYGGLLSLKQAAAVAGITAAADATETRDPSLSARRNIVEWPHWLAKVEPGGAGASGLKALASTETVPRARIKLISEGTPSYKDASITDG